jgi:hypothetical protein
VNGGITNSIGATFTLSSAGPGCDSQSTVPDAGALQDVYDDLRYLLAHKGVPVRMVFDCGGFTASM